MWGSDAIRLDLHFWGSTNFEREVVSTKNVLDRTAHLGILRPHTAEQFLVNECVFKLRCRPGLQSGNSHTADTKRALSVVAMETRSTWRELKFGSVS